MQRAPAGATTRAVERQSSLSELRQAASLPRAPTRRPLLGTDGAKGRQRYADFASDQRELQVDLRVRIRRPARPCIRTRPATDRPERCPGRIDGDAATFDEPVSSELVAEPVEHQRAARHVFNHDEPGPVPVQQGVDLLGLRIRSSTLSWPINDVVRSLSDRSTTSRRAGSCLRTKNTKTPVSTDALYNTVGADCAVRVSEHESSRLFVAALSRRARTARRPQLPRRRRGPARRSPSAAVPAIARRGRDWPHTGSRQEPQGLNSGPVQPAR